MGRNYDNDAVRRRRREEVIRPVIDSFEDRIMLDSRVEERSYKYLDLFPREFIKVEKKKVI